MTGSEGWSSWQAVIDVTGRTSWRLAYNVVGVALVWSANGEMNVRT